MTLHERGRGRGMRRRRRREREREEEKEEEDRTNRFICDMNRFLSALCCVPQPSGREETARIPVPLTRGTSVTSPERCAMLERKLSCLPRFLLPLSSPPLLPSPLLLVSSPSAVSSLLQPSTFLSSPRSPTEAAGGRRRGRGGQQVIGRGRPAGPAEET